MLAGIWLPSKEVAREGERGGRYGGNEGSHGKRLVRKTNLNLSLSYPLSTRTSDPDELSNKPQRHSRVSGVAKLISSSKTQSPFRKACTRLPSINLKANALSAFFCCFLNCLMSWCNVCHSKRRCLIRSSGV